MIGPWNGPFLVVLLRFFCQTLWNHIANKCLALSQLTAFFEVSSTLQFLLHARPTKQLFVETSTDTKEAKDESDSDYEEDQVDEQTGLVGAHCPSVCW